MKKILALGPVLLLCACITTKPVEQTLVLDKDVQGMSRNEVILAINECEANNTRAVVIYTKRKINGFTADIVVDVTCAPKYKL